MNGRTSTGINGLDPLINGGFVSNSINLVTGGTGTGKTIFLAHFLYDGAMKKERGIFISFEQDILSLKQDLAVFGFDFDKLEEKGLIKFIYMGPYKQKDLQAELLKEVTKFRANRVVIDSLSVFAMSFKDEYEIRKQIYTLGNLLNRMNCTILASSETIGEAPLDVSSGGKLTRYGVEEFIADSVITLHNAGIGGEADRALRIVKMRRTNHARGVIPMQITNKGMVVKK